MNLQELLNYRERCIIHQDEPMFLWSEPDKSKTKIVVSRLADGIIGHRKDDVSDGDAFHFDGTCNVDYSQALGRIKFPWIVGIMCEKCHRVPTHKFMGRTVPSIDNIKHQVHFYTFALIPKEDKTYECHPGMEVIKHFDGEKFYHMTGHVGGGSAAFNMGNLVMEDTLDQLISSTSVIKVPQFNPATITSVGRMMEKMQIYNLFS